MREWRRGEGKGRVKNREEKERGEEWSEGKERERRRKGKGKVRKNQEEGIRARGDFIQNQFITQATHVESKVSYLFHHIRQ